MLNVMKEYKLLGLTFFAYMIVGLFDKEIFGDALANTLFYLVEMVQILPAVFIISSLIDAWVPNQTILGNFGKESGLKGKIMSVLVGSISAGPIYAAFPITASLIKKGASIENGVIIISAWAVIKLPMLLVESRFLGVQFAAVRYLLTVPVIMLVGLICGKIIDREGVFEISEDEQSDLIEKIAELLPGANCRACGFSSCYDYARAIYSSEVSLDKCKVGGKEVKNNLFIATENTAQYSCK